MAAVGVAAVGAWAVGRYGGFDVPVRSVIYHWDGVAWERQSSPHVGAGANVLNGIAASSPSKAWGVRLYGDGTAARTSVAGC